MTQKQMKMADLYTRLAAIGFPKKFIQQKVLPDWWSDEVDATSGVLAEGAMYISQRLNLDVRSLLTIDAEAVFDPTYQPKFKIKAGTDIQQLAIPRALSTRIAELVAYSCKHPYQSLIGLSVLDIRQQILQNRETVDLPGFLDFCWARGIPVVHFAEFPPKVHKFHGMVAYFYNRPVILVSLKHSSSARLLFIAAHELGHILKGHISQDGLLVDEEINLESSDEEEAEANQVAAELLLGKSGISYDVWKKFISGKQLATESSELAARDSIDPGVVALNISWNRAQRASTEKEKTIAWATGNTALKILEPNSNASQEINHYLCQNLDWGKLDDENQDYFSKMLSLKVETVG